MTNSADPDQLASPTDLDLHCLLRQGMSCLAREGLKAHVVQNKAYSIIHMYSDRQAWANSVDPDEMLQNAASHQGLHCLSHIQQY